MTDTINYAGPETYSTIQLDIRDDATDEQRQMAQCSAEGLLARSVDATARRRSHDDVVTKLTDAVNAPLAKLINDDPGANAALEEMSTRPLLRDDGVVDLDVLLRRRTAVRLRLELPRERRPCAAQSDTEPRQRRGRS